MEDLRIEERVSRLSFFRDEGEPEWEKDFPLTEEGVGEMVALMKKSYREGNSDTLFRVDGQTVLPLFFYWNEEVGGFFSRTPPPEEEMEDRILMKYRDVREEDLPSSGSLILLQEGLYTISENGNLSPLFSTSDLSGLEEAGRLFDSRRESLQKELEKALGEYVGHIEDTLRPRLLKWGLGVESCNGDWWVVYPDKNLKDTYMGNSLLKSLLLEFLEPEIFSEYMEAPDLDERRTLGCYMNIPLRFREREDYVLLAQTLLDDYYLVPLDGEKEEHNVRYYGPMTLELGAYILENLDEEVIETFHVYELMKNNKALMRV